jgi:hypothetical protein
VTAGRNCLSRLISIGENTNLRYHRRMFRCWTKHAIRALEEVAVVLPADRYARSISLQFVIAVLLIAASPAVAQHPVRSPIPEPPPPSSSGWHDVSLPDYRKHLQALGSIVKACAEARDVKTCNPALAGQDDRVLIRNGSNPEWRPVRYDWLRALLQRAQKKDSPSAAKAITGAKPPTSVASALPRPPTTAELLQSAEKRLVADAAQAESPATSEPGHTSQRAALEQVLAGREFRGLSRTSPTQTLAEKIDNWLNSLFAGAAQLGARAPWLGHAVVIGFFILVCVGLVWGLLQMERRWRIRLTPEKMVPVADAPSTRDWQLWLDDARKAAATGLWREAIHFVYWAAISRLESRRLWPSDRARTPREYLTLLAIEDPRRAGLTALTRSFERTWYGGRPAGESDYRSAEKLANALIAGGRIAASGAPEVSR